MTAIHSTVIGLSGLLIIGCLFALGEWLYIRLSRLDTPETQGDTRLPKVQEEGRV